MFERLKLKHTARDLEAKCLDEILKTLEQYIGMVFVYSKGYFEKMLSVTNVNESNVEELKNRTFISLLNTDDVGDNVGYFKENKSNVLVLKFDDIDETLEFSPNKFAKAFTTEQGEELLKFVDSNADSIRNGKCLVHCSAGVSRSGAVATFIVDYLGLDRNKFLEINKYIQPNPCVLRTMKRLTIYKDYE